VRTPLHASRVKTCPCTATLQTLRATITRAARANASGINRIVRLPWDTKGGQRVSKVSDWERLRLFGRESHCTSIPFSLMKGAPRRISSTAQGVAGVIYPPRDQAVAAGFFASPAINCAHCRLKVTSHIGSLIPRGTILPCRMPRVPEVQFVSLQHPTVGRSPPVPSNGRAMLQADRTAQ